jgi:hypothetical protein
MRKMKKSYPAFIEIAPKRGKKETFFVPIETSTPADRRHAIEYLSKQITGLQSRIDRIQAWENRSALNLKFSIR